MAIISGSITFGDDNIVADGANDVINALSGNDTVDGGAGNDTLIGGSDNDTLIGGQNNDILKGNSGDDFLSGGGGTDTVEDSGNVNFILTDTTLTGNGSDTLSQVERVKLTGGVDANILNASAFTLGSVTLNGGDGNDSLDGGSGNDTLNGGSDNDFIDGNAGNDTLQGGSGNDTLTGGSGNDSLKGGTGTLDRIHEFGTNFTLTDTSLVGNGTDTFSNIEHVRLGEGRLFTSDLTYDASAFTLGTVEFDGGSGDDIFNGGSGNDDLDGGEGSDTLNGGSGNDDLDGEEGRDTLNGGAGIDDLSGREGNDTLNGGANYDYLEGNEGNDILNGGAGNDTLNGDDNNDTLDGFSAAGGIQVDELTGGASADLFVLGTTAFGAYYVGSSSEATITDFSVADDEIQLAGSSGDYSLTASGADAVLFQGVDTIAIVQSTSVLDVSSSLVFV